MQASKEKSVKKKQYNIYKNYTYHAGPFYIFDFIYYGKVFSIA